MKLWVASSKNPALRDFLIEIILQLLTGKKESRLIILLAAALPLGMVIAFLHKSALDNYWYWLYWWMDVVTHYLGGAFVALLLLWFALGSKYLRNVVLDYRQLFLFLVLGTLVIGVGWEIFEYLAGVFLIEKFFPDTLYDIVLDIAGSVTIYLIYYKVRALWVK